MNNKKHYGDTDGLRVLSINAIITLILSNRNFGKTWTFKKRAFKRAMKHHKKTLWLRMFKKEVKEAVATFFSSQDLQRYCGIDPYDKKTNPKGNFRQIGNTFYYRPCPKSKWKWFLKVCALSDADAVRSADDVDVDTIVFDEMTKTPEKYARYRGNMVNDFIDIFFSIKREHEVRCILIGNKESINNPFLTYFGIKPLPTTFEGIRKYRAGSLVIQQINNKVDDDNSEYDKKVRALLNGTSYGNYLYKSTYKNATAFKKRKTPATASLYCQLVFNGNAFKITTNNGLFYVNNRIENTRRVYVNKPLHKYTHELNLVKRQRQLFTTFVNAVADNIVYYDSEQTYEAVIPFLQWLQV